MTINSSSVLFIIVFTIGGMLLGALVMYLIQDAVKGQRDAKNPSHTQPIPKPDEDLLPKSNVEEVTPLEAGDKPAEPEKRDQIVSIWHSSDDGTMQVMMDGHWHLDTTTMSDTQRKRFEDTFQKSADWLGIQFNNEPEVVAQSPITTASQNRTVTNDDLISIVPPLVPPPAARKLSIVEQVDDILQEILEKEGLASRKIRLTEMPNKGVVVWTGNKSFEGIEAVPDEEVKGYIRQAVKRWEELASR
jgi:hypothetical protein